MPQPQRPLITLYTARLCSYCVRAKRLLDEEGLDYREIYVDEDDELCAELVARTGRATVPQIWFGDRHIGGFTDLYALRHSDQWRELINAVPAAPVSDTTAATSYPHSEP